MIGRRAGLSKVTSQTVSSQKLEKRLYVLDGKVYTRSPLKSSANKYEWVALNSTMGRFMRSLIVPHFLNCTSAAEVDDL